ncbi:unnamed protein product [Peniophora sp. CBMAI 1063]|nr:unnamed protein product [Peniophora sp. CBMAI 1063]
MGSPSTPASPSVSDEDIWAPLRKDIESRVEVVQQLAIATRLSQATIPISESTLTCTPIAPPQCGSYNAVYELRFSDGVRWALRVPQRMWSASRTRAMQLDILAQTYISSHTGIPIPKIHAYSCDRDNVLGYPYIVMDFVPAKRLVSVWNDASWWTGSRSRDRVLEQMASHMVDMARLKFDTIGRLDYIDASQPDKGVHVVPFHEHPDWEEHDFIEPPPGLAAWQAERAHLEFGPFTSTYAWLRAMLEERRRFDKGKDLVVLQLLLGVVPETTYDGGPFVFVHGNLDSQNVLVDDEGNIAAIIDWDDTFVGPRQLGALGYPPWLTVDWDPTFHGWNVNADAEHNSRHDSPEELIRLRKVYLDAVDAASGGTLTGPVRNSHIASSVYCAITSPESTPMAMLRLSQYIFGRSYACLTIEDELHSSSAWLNAKETDTAECLDFYQPSASRIDSSSEAGGSGTGSDDTSEDETGTSWATERGEDTAALPA